uniref:Ribonuclease HI family protein n=1 Tax=candidate division CPR3 bacterium TaxID=2268181 RepID=A0A7C5YS98_UNCC3
MENKREYRYTLHTDGGSRGNPGISAYGAVLISEAGNLEWIAGKYLGIMTNNEAEYEGIYRGLLAAKRKNVKNIKVVIDSEIAYKQLTGKWKIKNERIYRQIKKIKSVESSFLSVIYVYRPRERNFLADRIVNIILDTVEQLSSPSRK